MCLTVDPLKTTEYPASFTFYFVQKDSYFVVLQYSLYLNSFSNMQAAYSKEKHISKVALTSIHDILSELLKRRNELPHFWFYDALFKPFDTLMSADGCEEDMHDQVGGWLVHIIFNFTICHHLLLVIYLLFINYLFHASGGSVM